MISGIKQCKLILCLTFWEFFAGKHSQLGNVWVKGPAEFGSLRFPPSFLDLQQTFEGVWKRFVLARCWVTENVGSLRYVHLVHGRLWRVGIVWKKFGTKKRPNLATSLGLVTLAGGKMLRCLVCFHWSIIACQKPMVLGLDTWKPVKLTKHFGSFG